MSTAGQRRRRGSGAAPKKKGSGSGARSAASRATPAVPPPVPAPVLEARARPGRRLEIAIAVLAVIGLGVASYLTYVHYAGLKVLCPISGGCETVQSSRYAELDHVPVALLGLIGYVGILASLAARGELGRLATFALALTGCAFSLYLTYRELFSIHAICPWCVSSAILMTILAILTSIRVVRAEPV